MKIVWTILGIIFVIWLFAPDAVENILTSFINLITNRMDTAGGA